MDNSVANTSANIFMQYDLDGLEVYSSSGETVADLEEMEQEEILELLEGYENVKSDNEAR